MNYVQATYWSLKLKIKTKNESGYQELMLECS